MLSNFVHFLFTFVHRNLLTLPPPEVSNFSRFKSLEAFLARSLKSRQKYDYCLVHLDLETVEFL